MDKTQGVEVLHVLREKRSIWLTFNSYPYGKVKVHFVPTSESLKFPPEYVEPCGTLRFNNESIEICLVLGRGQKLVPVIYFQSARHSCLAHTFEYGQAFHPKRHLAIAIEMYHVK